MKNIFFVSQHFLVHSQCLISAILLIDTIVGRHHHHGIIRFLHGKDRKRNLIKSAFDDIHSANFTAFKWALISSPLIYLDQCFLFLIRTWAETPLFLSVTSRALKTQKLLSRTAILAMWKISLQRCNNNPVVAPLNWENPSSFSSHIYTAMACNGSIQSIKLSCSF